MAEEDIIQLDGLGTFECTDSDYVFLATDINRYSIGEIHAIPYNCKEYRDLDKLVTRAIVYHGGKLIGGNYVERDISPAFYGKFENRQHYIDVVTRLTLDIFNHEES